MSKAALVWFEPITPGTAPGYHLTGTIARLRELGFAEKDVIVVASRTTGKVSRWLSVLLRAMVLPLRADVVLARWHPLMLLPSLLWRLRGRRVIFLVQGTMDDAFAAYPILGRVPGGRRILDASLRVADAWITPHQGIADWLSTVVPGPVPVIPNGFPIAELDSAPEAALDLPARYVVFAGALATWQGVDTMLAAARHERWPEDVRLVVIGDGRESAKVAAAGGRVDYYGRRPPTTVRLALRGAIASLSPKLLVESTRRGISPFKLLEAGLEGVPIVASAVPGQSEYVERHGNGLLIEPGSVVELVDAVARLAADPDLCAQLGAAGRAAVQEHRWEAHAAQLGAVIAPPG